MNLIDSRKLKENSDWKEQEGRLVLDARGKKFWSKAICRTMSAMGRCLHFILDTMKIQWKVLIWELYDLICDYSV